jgi:integrase
MNSENPDKPQKKKKPVPRAAGGKTPLGPNKWRLRIFRMYDANNKRVYYSEVFRGGSRDADERLVELKNRQKAGEPLRVKAKLFRDFVQEWIEERNNGVRREATIEHYQRIAEAYIIPEFGGLALADITEAKIQRYYTGLRKKERAPATVRLIHVLLASIFKLAEKRELIRKNPMRFVEPPPTPKPKPEMMNQAEARAFLEAASQHPEGFMFALAFHLGARPCEYLGLMWSDIDFAGHRITIQRSLKQRKVKGKYGEWYCEKPKTVNSLRSVTITTEIARGLEERRRAQLEERMKAGPSWATHGFVFTDPIGEPLKFEYVRRLHKQILKEAELPEKFQLRSSRHACATALIAAGVDPKTVSSRLGHSSVKITLDVYVKPTDEREREASDKLGEMFGTGGRRG